MQEYLLCVKQRMLTSLEAAVASEQDAGFSKLAAKQVGKQKRCASSICIQSSCCNHLADALEVYL